ncbi:hypothetical protein H5410_002720 [Solanum commersonii]|uniref:Uncharacterized protein n=1 Tax=Solanum commersonii TaxID=4109 RepID=A0A9J6B320_SOLCO|nr:hypothetical protein H5410_002720 [Solanum commersonii]
MIMSLSRSKLTTLEVIETENSLMGSTAPTLPAVDISIMRRGPTLTLEQQITLSRTKLTTLESLMGSTAPALPVVDINYEKGTYTYSRTTNYSIKNQAYNS